MIYYAIPLRAKSTSNNWEDICLRLDDTLQSIIASGGEYKVFVACHDEPEESSRYKNLNIHFLKVSHSVPGNKDNYMADKESKKNVARRKILEEARVDDLFMFLDADDILSSDFYPCVQKVFDINPNADDIAFYTGFIFDVSREKIAFLDGKEKFFYRNCGSCFVSKIRKFDLNQENEVDTFLCALKNHTLFPEISIKFGRSVIAFKEPVVCYIVNHGSNDATERVGVSAIESFVNQFLCKDPENLSLFRKKFPFIHQKY